MPKGNYGVGPIVVGDGYVKLGGTVYYEEGKEPTKYTAPLHGYRNISNVGSVTDTTCFEPSEIIDGKKTMGEEFESLVYKMLDTFQAKNSDYGGAVDITYLMLGDKALLVRLWDKLLRITQLTLSGKSLVKDESVRDNLLDLATYANIGLAQKNVYEGTTEELGRVFKEFIELAYKKAEEGE